MAARPSWARRRFAGSKCRLQRAVARRMSHYSRGRNFQQQHPDVLIRAVLLPLGQVWRYLHRFVPQENGSPVITKIASELLLCIPMEWLVRVEGTESKILRVCWDGDVSQIINRM